MSHVARFGPITGGFDTIKEVVDVTNNGSGKVDCQAYAKCLWRDGFTVSSGPQSDFTASSPDGGCVEVDDSTDVCKITFSYFGDTY